MKLLFRVSPDNLIAAYQRLRQMLRGHEMIIFDSMCDAVTSNNLSDFTPPTSKSEFEQKHAEIESILKTGRIRGQETAFSLMEQILKQIQNQGGIRGISTDKVVECLYFETADPTVRIRLRDNHHWVAEWIVKLDHKGAREQQRANIYIYSKTAGEIAPRYVVEYVNSALYNYAIGMYSTAVALLTIAVEATLRDVLVKHGYAYNPRANSVDLYPYTTARLKVSDNGYLITYDNQMPKVVTDFLASTNGATEIEISVKRLIKPRRTGDRTDIYMRVPESIVGHLSLDVPTQPAQHPVGGLGAALRIGRKIRLITTEELPLDFEEVLIVVRNNLIHLSGDALETKLTMMPPSGEVKLKDFLDDGEIVFDFITSIPDFINSQYLKLRQLP